MAQVIVKNGSAIAVHPNDGDASLAAAYGPTAAATHVTLATLRAVVSGQKAKLPAFINPVSGKLMTWPDNALHAKWLATWASAVVGLSAADAAAVATWVAAINAIGATTTGDPTAVVWPALPSALAGYVPPLA